LRTRLQIAFQRGIIQGEKGSDEEGGSPMEARGRENWSWRLRHNVQARRNIVFRKNILTGKSTGGKKKACVEPERKTGKKGSRTGVTRRAACETNKQNLRKILTVQKKKGARERRRERRVTGHCGENGDGERNVGHLRQKKEGCPKKNVGWANKKKAEGRRSGKESNNKASIERNATVMKDPRKHTTDVVRYLG